MIFIIKRKNGADIGRRDEFLVHERHEHYWSKDRNEAMEYTKKEAADALAAKMGGEVIPK